MFRLFHQKTGKSFSIDTGKFDCDLPFLSETIMLLLIYQQRMPNCSITEPIACGH